MSEEVKEIIYKQIIEVMKDCKAIGKDRRNAVQNYKFRGIDDIYNELQSILAKHGVFSVPHITSERSEERKTKNGGLLIYRILGIEYTFYATDGSSFKCDVIGEGMDSGDKASNKAMSVAHKYALLQVFCIPTEETKDPENDNPEPLPKDKPKPATQKKSLPIPKKNDYIDTWKKWIDRGFEAGKSKDVMAHIGKTIPVDMEKIKAYVNSKLQEGK